jgi:protein phosphatase
MTRPLKTPTDLRQPLDEQPTSVRRSVSMPASGKPADPQSRRESGDTAPPPSLPPIESEQRPARPFPEPDVDDDAVYNAPTVQREVPAEVRELPGLWDDDDEDEAEEITIVGEMPEAVKALRRGYRKKMPQVVDDRPDIEIHFEQDVDPLLVEELLEDGPVDQTRKIMVLGHGATDRGRKRKINQDAALVMPHHHTFLIADGMGGHVAGEIASGLAVDVVEDAIRRDAFDGEPHMLWPQLGDELARAIEMANLRIFGEAGIRELEGMGTTCTAVRFSLNRQRLYIAHVGDSRCYRIRDERIIQLTEDHTIANLMGVEGPMGAQLSRAVGVEPTVEVDLIVDVPEVGDRYLLCTDGLTKMLPDAAILEIVLDHKNLARGVDALIATANHFGGKDNIGVVLIQVFPAAHR